MGARAAKAVGHFEVTECGVEISAKEEPNAPFPEPDAFGVAGRPVNGLCGLSVFVCLALVLITVLGSIGWCGCGGLALVRTAALGSGSADTKEDREGGGGKVPQNCISKLKPLTHEFPNSLADHRGERAC